MSRKPVNYKSISRNMPEERISHLQRVGSLKSRIQPSVYAPVIRQRWEGDEPGSGMGYYKRVTRLNGIDILTY
jgi:hypothetical protein